MGGPTIAAVVLIILAIVGGMGLVIYFKAKEMYCFQREEEPRREGSYREIPQTSGDVEKAVAGNGLKASPILKN